MYNNNGRKREEKKKWQTKMANIGNVIVVAFTATAAAVVPCLLCRTYCTTYILTQIENDFIVPGMPMRYHVRMLQLR